MVSLAEVRASNAQLTPSTTPRVAVFVGATAGIGKETLKQLISCGFPIKAYVIGRNKATHEPIVHELCALNKKAEIVYLEGEISLMAEAKRLSEEITSHEKRLDLLFLSAGFLPFLGRQETTEGFELSTAVAYYSRQIFVRRLLPLLIATSSSGAASYSPRIVNILGTGVETANLFLDDLTLKETGRFNVPNYVSHCATMTTTSLKRLAEKPENQGVVFIHNHPGLVSTDLFRKSWGDKWGENGPPGGASAPSGTYTRSTPQESGERSLYLITSAKYGGKGVPLQDGQTAGATVKEVPHGSLFCVGHELETLQLHNVVGELEKTGAADLIWNETDKAIGVYL